MKPRAACAALAGAAAFFTVFSTTLQAQEMKQPKKAVKVVQTAGRDVLGEFAPDFARYNDDILFGEVWSKNDVLPLRERSIVTLSALISSGVIDSSLKYHIESAKKNGVTQAEIVEVITQLGFYAGWPKAWAAFRMAKEVYADAPAAPAQQQGAADGVPVEEITRAFAAKGHTTFPIGKPNTAYEKYFTGKTWLAPLAGGHGINTANVTFAPGVINHWHKHHKSCQVLVGAAGEGYYQIWGEAPQKMEPGTTVTIPAGVKHWHGAAPGAWLQHLAIMQEGAETEWLEPVDPAEYDKLK